MKVQLQRIGAPFHFEGTGTAGIKVSIDGPPDYGGTNAGARPMELLLMGLGSCSAVDIALILQKQRQQVDDFSITVEGTRVPDSTPSVFRSIHMHFTLSGPLDQEKVRKAIDLSVEKYCSVYAILNKTAEITHSFSIVE